MVFKPGHSFDLSPLPPDLGQKDLFEPELVQLTVRANRAISELNGLCRAIPNPYSLLMNIPVLQEAVSSSEIEGIHTTVETLLEVQIKLDKEQDQASKETLRYKEALYEGFKDLEKYKSLPTRIILNIHKQLMPNGGHFKKQGNQIKKGSKVIYTPPSPIQMNHLMSNWENYINSADEKIDPLIKIAMSHYQFEAIHPFSDGNGRTGRILIVLQMVLYKLLNWPVLYVSGYLIKNRQKYYSNLLNITKSGHWLEFIKFMMKAFYEQAQVTQKVIKDIIEEKNKMRRILKSEHKSIYNWELLEHLFAYPITYPTFMGEKLNITYQTASKYLSDLEEAGLLSKKQSGRYVLYYNFNLLDCLKT